jgi:hypothetical protein
VHPDSAKVSCSAPCVIARLGLRAARVGKQAQKYARQGLPRIEYRPARMIGSGVTQFKMLS